MNRNLLTFLIGLLALALASAPTAAEVVPGLGRFLQRDPNMTGQVVMNDTAWFHGRAPSIDVPRVDIRAMYGDGMNLYEYLGSNPANRSDPMGLSWDPFDEAFAIGGEQLWSGLLGINQALYRAKQGMRAARAYERAAFLWFELVLDRDAGILFSLVGGPLLSTLCFEAGTPIVLADGSAVTIETVALGAAVFSTNDGQSGGRPVTLSSADPDAYERIDPVTWRIVEFRLEDTNRGTVRVKLLRPLAWFQATGLRAGSEFAITIAEMNLSGTARVEAIGPCPDIQASVAGGQLVTGTFITERAAVIRLWCEGSSKPIGTTPTHPVYSEDRAGWVPAGELRPGERLRTLAGIAKVARVEPGQPTTVYNFEVHRSHTYYVGEEQVWVHNPCFGVRVPGGGIGASEVRRGAVFPGARAGNTAWYARFHHFATKAARRAGNAADEVVDGWVTILDDLGKVVEFTKHYPK